MQLPMRAMLEILPRYVSTCVIEQTASWGFEPRNNDRDLAIYTQISLIKQAGQCSRPYSTSAYNTMQMNNGFGCFLKYNSDFHVLYTLQMFLWSKHLQYTTTEDRRSKSVCILVIQAAQPGPNGRLSCLHSFKVF